MEFPQEEGDLNSSAYLLQRIAQLEEANQNLKMQLDEKIAELEETKEKLKLLQDAQFDSKIPEITEPKSPNCITSTKIPPVILVDTTETNIILDEPRIYNRELHTKPDLILSTFFRKLFLQISGRSWTPFDFYNKIITSFGNALSSTQFNDLLQNEKLLFGTNERDSVFDILQVDGLIQSDLLLKHLQVQVDEHQSNKSSDISSPVSNNENIASFVPIEISKSDVSEILEKLSVQVLANFKASQNFKEKCMEIFPKDVKLENMVKLLLDKDSRIEDGPERNKVASYFMKGKEFTERDELIENIISELFQDETEIQLIEDRDEITQIYESKAEFIDKCTELDSKDTGCVTWSHIVEILHQLNIDLSSTALKQFEVQCYAIRKSFNFIPYKDIFDDPIQIIEHSNPETPINRPSLGRLKTRLVNDSPSDEEEDEDSI